MFSQSESKMAWWRRGDAGEEATAEAEEEKWFSQQRSNPSCETSSMKENNMEWKNPRRDYGVGKLIHI